MVPFIQTIATVTRVLVLHWVLSGTAVISASASPDFFVGPTELVISDTIILVADTRRDRDNILKNDVRSTWVSVLGNNATISADGQGITVIKDVAYKQTLKTADGAPIRLIEYELHGKLQGAVNVSVKDVKQAFQTAIMTKNFGNIWAISTSTSDFQLLPHSSQELGKAPKSTATKIADSSKLSTTTSNQTSALQPVINITGLEAKPTAVSNTPVPPKITASPSDQTILSNIPVVGNIAGPGNFSIDDIVVVVADTRRAMFNILEQDVRPIWESVLGGNATIFPGGEGILVTKDSSFYPMPTSPEGASLRRIWFQIHGKTEAAINIENIKQAVRTAMTVKDSHNIWAIFPSAGVFQSLSHALQSIKSQPDILPSKNGSQPVSISTSKSVGHVQIGLTSKSTSKHL